MRYLVFIFILIGFSACTKVPEPKPEPKIVYKEKIVIQEKECPKPKECKECKKCKICPKTKTKTKIIYKDYKKLVVGELEKIYFPAYDLYLDARIDTGATTTSINALNIVSFERDGKDWVRFELLGKDEKVIKIKKIIEKKIKVKRHEKDAQERYVVKMRLNLSTMSKFINVSLTDRQGYKFPVLIGRNYLNGNAAVDVALKYTKEPNKINK